MSSLINVVTSTFQSYCMKNFMGDKSATRTHWFYPPYVYTLS